jgi:transposase
MLILQRMEDISDRQAAEHVRRCIDWKYLLGLDLDDPGFNFSLLSDFRLPSSAMEHSESRACASMGRRCASRT